MEMINLTNKKLNILEKIEKNAIKKSINKIQPVFRSEREDLVSDRTEENLALVRLFKAFFNNKMTILIFLCRSDFYTPTAAGLNSVCHFLDDLYRHMLDGHAQRQYRRKFIWIKGFFRKLPSVRPSQRTTALRMISSLYDCFGIDFPLEREGVEQ